MFRTGHSQASVYFYTTLVLEFRCSNVILFVSFTHLNLFYKYIFLCIISAKLQHENTYSNRVRKNNKDNNLTQNSTKSQTPEEVSVSKFKV
jgi:hypothetical protein